MPPPQSWAQTTYAPCGGRYSSDFVCGNGSTCLPLAADYSAALCCPEGQSCNVINPISCDTGLWNATTSPYNQAHSAHPVQLSSCGAACCPLSYTCNERNQCASSKSVQADSLPGDNKQQTTTTTETTGAITTTSPTARLKTSSLRKTTSTSAATATPSYRPAGPMPRNGLDMTTKALISVLVALLLIIVITLLWRYVARRRADSDQVQPEERRHYYSPPHTDAELTGVSRRLRTPVCEMNGTKTPGELSEAGSIHCDRLSFPRELPDAYLSYYFRPQSINSEKRELDAWSLHGWTTEKDEWS